MEIPRGRGVSKALFFEGKYDTKMEFPEGWGVPTKKPSMCCVMLQLHVITRYSMNN